MIVSCSTPFSSNDNPQCFDVVSLSDSSTTGNFYACESAFSLSGAVPSCSGSRVIASSVGELPANYFLVTSNNVVNPDPYHIQFPDYDLGNILVNDYLATVGGEQNNSSAALSSADYAQLLGAALPVLVVAFSFRFIFRFIMNR